MDKYQIPTIHKVSEGISVQSTKVFSYHTHMHSYYEMTFYEPFDGIITINDKAFKIDTPTVVLVIPSDFHRIEAPKNTEARIIKIAFDAEPSLIGETIGASIILQKIPQTDFIYRLFREIADAPDQSIYKTFLVHTALLAISRKGLQVLPSEKTAGNELAKKALRIVNKRFGENISLMSVAKELSVSPQYLSTVFKKNTGINFIEHLSNVRLRRASKLLIETQDSVTRISEMCGYGNLSHFLRCFKTTFGVSPSVYRKNNT